MQIVFVHGIWDSGRVFRRMAAYLSEAGRQCHTPDLLPTNGAHGLVDLSEKLQVYIDDSLEPEVFALVGFSMGSLISRYYLQRLGGLERVSHFFSISGPHRSTLTAHLWPGKAARDMRFRSRFLRDLNADISEPNRIYIKTYRTPFDLIVHSQIHVSSRHLFHKNLRIASFICELPPPLLSTDLLRECSRMAKQISSRGPGRKLRSRPVN